MTFSNFYLNKKIVVVVVAFKKAHCYLFHWIVILKTAVGKVHFDGEPQILDFHHR